MLFVAGMLGVCVRQAYRRQAIQAEAQGEHAGPHPGLHQPAGEDAPPEDAADHPQHRGGAQHHSVCL